ncbi:MAG: response regulator [Bacteroidetes bacterium]|nr:response regulator [Bacteroidota bacterium]
MKKILIIDDHDYILESTALLLRFEGYDVITATNGSIGVETALATLPDMVLCDISMPELDGFGVLNQLRATKEFESTPFIFLTARAEKSDMREGMARGADDYLVKPYTRDELVAAVNSLWEKRSKLERRFGERIEEVTRNVTYALPHEFRIVLNQVMGSASYLKSIAQSATSDNIEEMTQDILESAQRLRRITENFLWYVQIESLLADPVMRENARVNKTDEPSSSLYDLVSAKAMKFNRMDDIVYGEVAEGITIDVSTEHYHKIVDELADNALRFSEVGKKIFLDAKIEGDFFIITIEDQGRGMSAEQIRNIGAYKQFDRLVYEQQGVGLGLAIAKRIVELHEGSFRVDSVEGQGTKITFGLPIFKHFVI